MKGACTLAIDPGTQCGWALHTPQGKVLSGVWDLRPKYEEGPGHRYLRLRSHLDQLHREHGIGFVVYEDVRRHQGTAAAHVYGGLTATLFAWCETDRIQYKGVGVGVWKKAMTGKGNARKEEVLQKVRRRWGPGITDHNEADARMILSYQLGEGL